MALRPDRSNHFAMVRAEASAAFDAQRAKTAHLKALRLGQEVEAKAILAAASSRKATVKNAPKAKTQLRRV